MKLSAEFVTDWPEALVVETARGTLSAKRINPGYLKGLRHVWGNQAEADRRGAVLDQCIRADFTTQSTMRTINRQMLAARRVVQQYRKLGEGRSATVYAYQGQAPDFLADLAALARKQEVHDDAGRALYLLTLQGQRAAHAFNERQETLGIADAEVPY